jgi:hypothetical protein
MSAIFRLFFLGNECAGDSQSIANLFAELFQSVYVRDDWIPDSDLLTADDSHKISIIEIFKDALLGLIRRQQGTRPGRNYTSYFESVYFGFQSSFDILF